MADDTVVTELRSELWEKERKLTDIRLEALGSAHRLEQLQEAMSNMQVCVCVCEGRFLRSPLQLIFTTVFALVSCTSRKILLPGKK